VFFKEPQRSGETNTASIAETLRNFGQGPRQSQIQWHFADFSGYWIVYWQEFISCRSMSTITSIPHQHGPHLLSDGPLVVIALTVAMSVGPPKKNGRPFSAVILGTVISMIAFTICITQAVCRLCTLGLSRGEIIRRPLLRNTSPASRHPTAGATYMGFDFCPSAYSLVGDVRRPRHAQLRSSHTSPAPLLVFRSGI